jgi:hypothetical protein
LTLGFVQISADPQPLGEPLLIRAVGPSLAEFGISSPLADPEMTMWKNGQDFGPMTGYDISSVFAAEASGAFPLVEGDADSALMYGLAQGNYTIQIGSATNLNGKVLGEIYNQNLSDPLNYLSNLSALSYVHASSSSTLGFVLVGPVSRTILIRAVGPALSAFGVPQTMPDPMIVLYGSYNGARGVIASNAGWLGNLEVASASSTVGAFSLSQGSKDAAILVTLQPGAYTFTLSSISGAAGTVLGEIYLLPKALNSRQ